MKHSYVILLSLCLFICGTGYGQQANSLPKEENTIRVMSYNIRNAKGMDKQTDYRRIADVIRSSAPDVIALQELDSLTNRSRQIDVLKHLADLTKMYDIYAASILFDGGQYGIGILSKESPLSHKRIALPGREEARSLLIVEFEKYVFACTHFSLTETDRQASAAILSHEAALYNKPFILAGDFNDIPGSPVLEALKADWQLLSNPKQPTFPADRPDRTIDYIFGYTSKGYTYTVCQSQVLNEPLASDHLPLFVDIRL